MELVNPASNILPYLALNEIFKPLLTDIGLLIPLELGFLLMELLGYLVDEALILHL